MLVLPGEDPGPMLRQLQNEPVTVRVHPGIPGDVGAARAQALRRGFGEWVSWVDPDDRIEPGLYSRLRDAITPGVNLIHTWELEHGLDGTTRERHFAHHGFIARRAAVMPLLPHMAGLQPEWRTVMLLRPVVTLPWVGYHWIRRRGSATIPLDRAR